MANAATMYDKHAVIQKLQKRGFTHEQAEGIAEVLAEPDASMVATKLDLQVLKTDFEKALHRQTGPHRRNLRASRFYYCRAATPRLIAHVRHQRRS
jgi:hypothetical protein